MSDKMTTGSLTKVILDVRLDLVVVDEQTHDVVAALLTRVDQRAAAFPILLVHVRSGI